MVRSKLIAGITFYYTAGATINSSGNYDMIVSKMSASGSILWTQTYNGSGNGNDYATDVQIDAVGNVYIAGTYFKDATDSTNAIVIKYNTAGTHKWTKTYNGAGSGNDLFTALQVGGNVVVAVGSTWQGLTNKYDMLAIRYDSSGNQVWAQNWDYTGLFDVAINLYNSGTKIYIAGGAQSAITTYKYAVVALKASDGSVQSSTVTGGTAFGFDQVTDLQLDPATGDIYITGGVLNVSTLYDYRTVKLDTALNIIWTATYSGAANLNDVASGLYIDSVGNVIVTGYSTTTSQNKNYATVKYNSSGTQQWVATYNGASNGIDSATAIVTKGTDIYVTGASHNGISFDYYTIKYNSSGAQVWGISWNSASNKSDRPTAIAIDTDRGVVVTGQTKLTGAYTYHTVKYITKNVLTPTDGEDLNPAFCFTENRGQLLDDAGNPTDIKFYNKTGGTPQQVYFADSYMSYVWAKMDTAQTSPVDSVFRVDMTFYGGNDDIPVYAKDERGDYENFFLAHLPDGCVRMKTYNQLYRSNIYDGIDVVYSSNPNGMKYFYVVKPGGDPTDVVETYTGANSITVNGNGDLVVSTDLGDIVHPRPRVWEIDASGNTYTLAWQPTYSVSGNNVSMSIGAYTTSRALIIGIDYGASMSIVQQITGTNLDWSTHYGSLSGGDTPFNSVEADKAGNSFYAGTTNGNQFPTQNGLQTIPGGGSDWTLVKIKNNAVRRWATYYGGTQEENTPYIDLDSSANIYFCGVTKSTVLPMASSQPPGAYVDVTHNGNYDLFIFKLDSTGTSNGLLWSTYYGGAGLDRPEGLWVNPYGTRLALVGLAGSGFPTVNRPNAYNNTTGASFILEFDALLDTLWATRFLSSGYVQDIEGDHPSGSLFIVGYTSANPGSMPFLDAGGPVYWQVDSSNRAFIMRIDINDTVRWCTPFGGSVTFATAVAVNGKDIYVVGHTSSTPGGFALMYTAGEYIDSTNSTNNSDGWIARFSIGGIEKWCTFWGNGGMEILYDVVVDDNDNAYVHGMSQSGVNALYATGNAYLQTLNTQQDAVILAFGSQNQRTWMTCFGGNQFESGNSLAVVGHSKLFIAGQSSSLPATYPWAYPNLIPNEYLDVSKTNTVQNTGYMARFSLDSVSTVGMTENIIPTGNFLIFPSPTSGNLTVEVNDLQGEDVRITVTDMLGQVVIDRKTTDNFGTLQEPLDLSTLSNGVYMVMVQIGNAVPMTQKVIKQE
ncbi:MAG TPA: T9SS type A sorting domain-containing protein [Bacteroidia bacterium]|nr:T9SS type A sorting domain-containing protein [Bacteroidia bacterium]